MRKKVCVKCKKGFVGELECGCRYIKTVSGLREGLRDNCNWKTKPGIKRSVRKRKKRKERLSKWDDYKLRKLFYKTNAWKQLRKHVYWLYPSKCMKCGEVKDLNVDHIYPLRDYPKLRLKITNMQVLCSRCNREKSNEIADYRTPYDLTELNDYISQMSKKNRRRWA